MEKPDAEISQLLQTIIIIVFAAIGGLLAYILRQLNADKNPKMFRALIEMFASGFVGFLAMLICGALELDWRWSGAIAGLFGWMGAETSIVLISKVVRTKLGLGNVNDKDT